MNKLRPVIGIIDCGVGNHTSILRCIRLLKFRAFISCKENDLNNADVLLLPGVGAFPTAMENLHQNNLTEYLQTETRKGRPLIGICLGMQLLAESSTELGFTTGLGLIPGAIEAIGEPKWHIGWNGLEATTEQELLHKHDGEVMYFNHSYVYKGPNEFIAARFRFQQGSKPFVAAIKRDNVIGLQFHPEKSQQRGLQLLEGVIRRLLTDVA